MLTTRRELLAAMAAISLPLPLAARDEVIDLEWSDLIPQGDGGMSLDRLRQLGVVEHNQHGELSSGFEQEEAAAVTTEYNGKIVRLPGFIVPLDFDAKGVTAFILAPFVGACIHVPPPPANQLVFVTTDRPYESKGLYDPVNVTGMFGTAATGTQLAQIGYALSADEIVPFG
ncbi:hypothetical protein SAMN06297129_2064 [Pseudooceanicola antarcticus]|uniref:DUF3299 domain-containing protein n=1 Tax=Pseudooceanicola antarcticus TaxID=1247613 RepID=A0A285ITC2_9RHOB|nr:DUF3299 domain-containing protein [Pseudooceanicola antarcticus]PJE32137.1 DUF3299 domain-containing protein [Pseudooceanicola antarcticus]SNY51238.1 hypothetical protein SAMN06297129_2064 [Pseudooceanicola antarcticus]